MKHIKLLENFNLEDILYQINLQCDRDKYHNPQIRTSNKSYNEEFIIYLWEISEIRRIDALGGTEAKSGFRRYDISDKVNFEDIIHMASTGISTGIKIVKYPMAKMLDYETWPGGYIEGFIRMDSDDRRFGEYFIWTYIKMDKLRDILEKFGDKLKLF
jgi:hypothetical protein